MNRFGIATLALLASLAGATGKDCCSGDAVPVLWSMRCSDDSVMTLSCDSGFYHIDSRDEPDEFVTDDEGRVHLLDEYSVNDYCMSRTSDASSNRSVAFVCFDGSMDGLDLFLTVLMSISIPLLLLTLIIYVSVPALRDLVGKCIAGYVASLTVSFSCVVSINWSQELSVVTCSFLGAFLYYSTLSAFAWLNLVTFNLWRSIRNKSFQMSDTRLFLMYLAWGVGVPLLACLAMVALNLIPGTYFTGHFSEFHCWFTDSFILWVLVYAPMLALMVLNIAMFVHSCWVLWRGYRDPTQSRIRSLRFKCLLVLKLFFISGVPWIFEVMSFSFDQYRYVWLVADSINSAQGIIVFLILVVFNRRVLRSLRRHRFCGLTWPESWGERDPESVSLSDADKVALGQIKETNP